MIGQWEFYSFFSQNFLGDLDIFRLCDLVKLDRLWVGTRHSYAEMHVVSSLVLREFDHQTSQFSTAQRTLCSAWLLNLSDALWSDWISPSNMLMVTQPHLCFLLSSRKKDWLNVQLCLKARQMGFGAPVPFSVFRTDFSSFWISGNSWYLECFQCWMGDSAECQ